MPVVIPAKPGKIGNTQGEIMLSAPPRNAINTPTKENEIEIARFIKLFKLEQRCKVRLLPA